MTSPRIQSIDAMRVAFVVTALDVAAADAAAVSAAGGVTAEADRIAIESL
jgi:hypothetical protein